MPAAGLRRSDVAGEQNDAPAIAALLNPASIALVGASDRSRWSVLAYENLSQGGFRGAVHLINPRGALAHGRQTATSCRALGAQVDVGLVMTPAAAVTEAIADLDAVAAVIVDIGEAIACLGPDLQELDVNPLWVRGDAVEALDALFVWRAKEKPCH